MDKDRPRRVMRPGYTDIGKGKRTRQAPIPYSQLSAAVQERLGADLTEHELLELIIIEAKMINLHLMSITGEEIEWP